jgi:enoyl-CoA hydratase/carnithine racemase
VADADIVIAASDATFLDPHVSVGQATVFEPVGLMRKASAEPVMRMAFVGRHERVDAARAHQLGWVSRVVDPPGALRGVAQRLAERVALASPANAAVTKRALWDALES